MTGSDLSPRAAARAPTRQPTAAETPTKNGNNDSWDVRVRRTTYWALTRTQLTQFATDAGFTAVHWHEPTETEYYQPILTTKRPT
ncbi:hypothetical protein GCM10009839_17170 [Catenulispora yoronensis]|uniref:Methyltransferase n=1 Tax=Catenulispora yoronensis TaxID=450799 RepID=A0ABN2TU69_9ACTN